MCAWIPIVILLLFIQVLGWILPLLGSPIGGILEPLSLVGFAFYMAAPAIAFCCAMVMLITLLVRQRLVALILSLAFIGGIYFIIGGQPYDIALTFDLFGTTQVNQSSEWVPSIANFSWWLQRIGLVFLAAGLLFIAVLIHPRLDGEKTIKQKITAAVLPAIGVALIFSAFQLQRNDFNRVDQWRAAHEELRKEPFPDIVSIQSVISINPGEELSADVGVVIKAPQEQPLNQALFSLNPGFEITEVVNSQGKTLKFDHQNGLLKVTLDKTLNVGEQTKIQMIILVSQIFYSAISIHHSISEIFL